MKRPALSICVILILWSLQACKNKAKNYNNPPVTDSISTTDSLKAVKDNTLKVVVPPDKNDVQFISVAYEGCLAESQLGKLALKHAGSKRVKNFGSIMVKDIAKADKRLLVLSQNKHIPLPTAATAEQQKTIDSLSKKSGSDFDKAYISHIIADHENYITIFTNTANDTSDPDIKAFANKALRLLKNHLDAINTINDSMK